MKDLLNNLLNKLTASILAHSEICETSLRGATTGLLVGILLYLYKPENLLVGIMVLPVFGAALGFFMSIIFSLVYFLLGPITRRVKYLFFVFEIGMLIAIGIAVITTDYVRLLADKDYVIFSICMISLASILGSTVTAESYTNTQEKEEEEEEEDDDGYPIP